MMKFTYAAALAAFLGAPAWADNISALVALPKDDFVKVHEDKFMSMLEIANELVMRVDDTFTKIIDAHSPLTDSEKAALSCAYDYYAEAGLLEDLARQITAMEPLRDRLATDPELNYVDLLIDETLQEELSGPNPEFLQAAAAACEGVLILTKDRFDPSQEFWLAFQEAYTAAEAE